MTELSLLHKPAFRARAVLVGERIDLRTWKITDSLSTTPLTIEVKGGGVAVLFRYGVVVFFDVFPMEEVAFLENIRYFVGNPYPAPETEELEIRVDPNAREEMKGGAVHLGSVGIERLQVIADVLSKSVVLALYESRVAANFDRIEPIAVELERNGRITAAVKELLKHIGAMLLSEHRVVGRAEMAEKPEILWEHPVLEGLFIRLEDEFEIRERHTALERKLNLIGRTAETLLELLHSRHELRVEWYIVMLIVFEILLTLYGMFIH